MRGPYPHTIERVDRLRELAAAGLTKAEAAREIGISGPAVSQIAARFGIHFHLRKAFDLPVHRRMREMFAAGMTPRQIAAGLNRPEDSIAVTLSKMGVTAGRRADPGRYRRPYDVPDHLFGRYKELRKLGLTMTEAGVELGLLSREAAEARAA